MDRRGLYRLLLPEALSLVIIASVGRMAPLEGWDDAFYVAQATSLFGDGDLLLHDDLWAFPLKLDERLRIITYTDARGALGNAFGLGPALLHSTYTWPVALTTSYPGRGLRGLFAVGSMALLWLLVTLQRSILVRLGLTPLAAQVCSWVAVLASPLALYATRAYLNSHLPSAVAVALLLRVALAFRDHPCPRWALATGLTAGFLIVTRWQDAVLVLGLPVLFWRGIRSARWRHAATAVAGAAFVVGLQPLAWQKQFGMPLLVPQGAHYIRWLSPQIGSFLFSPFHGALPWMPSLGVAAAAALAFAVKRDRDDVEGLWRRLALAFVLVLPLAVYVCSTPLDWWGGGSLGPRRLSSLVPMVAVLLGLLVRRLGRPAAWLLGALALWGVVTASAYMAGYDDLSLLFVGTPALDNPEPAGRYDQAAWFGWGAFHLIEPAFSFSDRPSNLDRVVGRLVILGLVAFLFLAWHKLARSPTAQRIGLAAALAWVAVWYVQLARVPSAVPWNLAWRGVVCQAEALPGEAPPSLRSAALVVRAARACVGGGEVQAEALLAAAGDRFFPRVEAGALCAFVRSPAGAARLSEMTGSPACR